MIERKLGTLDWSMSVNLSIFGMLVVDTWLAYSQCTGHNTGTRKDEKQKDFYTYLADELVDNQYDTVGGNRTLVRGGCSFATEISPTLCRITGECHLSPTKKTRRDSKGNSTSIRLQGRCLVCSRKSTHVCSLCNDEGKPGGREP
jgi:hypothetical protein